MGQMEGKNVFLTGASKGMGREMARGLGEGGRDARTRRAHRIGAAGAGRGARRASAGAASRSRPT